MIVIGGNTYHASGWIKTSSVDGGGSSISIIWLNTAYASDDPPPNIIERIDTLDVLTGTKAWTRVSGQYTAPSQAVVARFRLYTEPDSDNSGAAWFDDNEFLPANNAQTIITLDPTTTYQTITGWDFVDETANSTKDIWWILARAT